MGTWEEQVIEGPDLTMAGGRLHLLYSGGNFATSSYGEVQSLCAATNRACIRDGRLIALKMGRDWFVARDEVERFSKDQPQRRRRS